jgi:DNA-binding LacI/PurR family transcriptional regulator
MTGIKDVAQAAGVSVSTVSYVLSGKRTISSQTISKVMDVIDELGYVPNANAQRMRGGRSQIISISEPIRKDMNQIEFSSYFLQTVKHVKSAGYDALLLSGEHEAVDDIRRVGNNNLADGVILLDIETDDIRARRADSYGKPCVAIGYPQERRYCACIDIDFVHMGHMAAQRLFDLGHRVVAALRDLEMHYVRQSGYVILFRDAFLQRAEELGMTVMESGPVEYETFDPQQYVEDLLGEKQRPTALVSQADAAILNTVLDALALANVSIPDDISVLSCGTYFEAELMKAPISEIPLEPEGLCTKVTDILIDAIENGTDIRGVLELIEPKYVDRGSVSKPRSDFLRQS